MLVLIGTMQSDPYDLKLYGQYLPIGTGSIGDLSTPESLDWAGSNSTAENLALLQSSNITSEAV